MSNKVIWITGASTGIGKAIAIKFSKNGWNVAISARRLELLEEISKQNQNVFSFPLDVTNKDDCHKVFTEIKNKLGKIDLCVFSTGTWDPKKEKEIDIEQIENVMKVNFFGTLNSIKSVEKYFKDLGEGHISIVSSIAGYRGLPNMDTYEKFNLNDMTNDVGNTIGTARIRQVVDQGVEGFNVHLFDIVLNSGQNFRN